MFDHVLNVNSYWDFFHFWLTGQGSLESCQVDVKIAWNCWENVAVYAFSCCLEWLHGLTLWLNLNGLTWLYMVAWAIHDVSINEDVTVNNELTSLCRCASKASTKHESIETRFEVNQHCVTGLTIFAYPLTLLPLLPLAGDM